MTITSVYLIDAVIDLTCYIFISEGAYLPLMYPLLVIFVGDNLLKEKLLLVLFIYLFVCLFNKTTTYFCL